MNLHLLCVGGEDHDLRIPFLQALRARGLRITAAGTGDSTPFVQAGIDYHPFRFDRAANPWADVAAIRELSRILADIQPDIAQSFDTKPNFLVPLAARGTPDVLVVRTLNGLGRLYSSRSPLVLALRPVYRALHRLAARSTAMTIFQNHDDQAFFERHHMTARATSRLIHGSGVDVQRFERAAASAPAAAELRATFGLGASEVVITVTRMTRQKGIPTLLEAAAIVHAARPTVRFLLVGPRQSEGRQAVAQAAIDHHAPYVTALGRRSDIPALLSLADVFAFPTEYREGVPRALLEAALAGLPIVATRMPGCNDVVRHGWTGHLVAPRRPRSLATAIVHLLDHREEARAMGARAASLVRTEFNLDTTVSRYIAVYEELAQRSMLGRLRAIKNRVDHKPYPAVPSGGTN